MSEISVANKRLYDYLIQSIAANHTAEQQLQDLKQRILDLADDLETASHDYEATDFQHACVKAESICSATYCGAHLLGNATGDRSVSIGIGISRLGGQLRIGDTVVCQ